MQLSVPWYASRVVFLSFLFMTLNWERFTQPLVWWKKCFTVIVLCFRYFITAFEMKLRAWITQLIHFPRLAACAFYDVDLDSCIQCWLWISTCWHALSDLTVDKALAPFPQQRTKGTLVFYCPIYDPTHFSSLSELEVVTLWVLVIMHIILSRKHLQKKIIWTEIGK